jgi:hypothetical protein
MLYQLSYSRYFYLAGAKPVNRTGVFISQMPGIAHASGGLSSSLHGGGGRIRTSEGCADRFTVCSLWPLGNPSIKSIIWHTQQRLRKEKIVILPNWSWRRDLNPQPADYKSAALPIELRQRDATT